MDLIPEQIKKNSIKIKKISIDNNTFSKRTKIKNGLLFLFKCKKNRLLRNFEEEGVFEGWPSFTERRKGVAPFTERRRKVEKKLKRKMRKKEGLEGF